jgi:hypothetical protein
MGQADGGHEFMFQALGPDGIQQRIGQVQLGDLDGVHAHRADEHKAHRGLLQSQEAGEQPHRKNGDGRPEKHLENSEDIASVHQGAAAAEGPDFIQLSA